MAKRRLMAPLHDASSRSVDRALNDAEMELAEAMAEFHDAETALQMALHKYTAARDTATALLGHSPYADLDKADYLNRCGFRFINMRTGDAILQILREVPGPLTLEELTDDLYGGRANYPEGVSLRSVNAALMRTKGVIRLDDGRYTATKEEEFDS